MDCDCHSKGGNGTIGTRGVSTFASCRVEATRNLFSPQDDDLTTRRAEIAWRRQPYWCFSSDDDSVTSSAIMTLEDGSDSISALPRYQGRIESTAKEDQGNQVVGVHNEPGCRGAHDKQTMDDGRASKSTENRTSSSPRRQMTCNFLRGARMSEPPPDESHSFDALEEGRISSPILANGVVPDDDKTGRGLCGKNYNKEAHKDPPLSQETPGSRTASLPLSASSLSDHLSILQHFLSDYGPACSFSTAIHTTGTAMMPPSPTMSAKNQEDAARHPAADSPIDTRIDDQHNVMTASAKSRAIYDHSSLSIPPFPASNDSQNDVECPLFHPTHHARASTTPLRTQRSSTRSTGEHWCSFQAGGHRVYIDLFQPYQALPTAAQKRGRGSHVIPPLSLRQSSREDISKGSARETLASARTGPPSTWDIDGGEQGSVPPLGINQKHQQHTDGRKMHPVRANNLDTPSHNTSVSLSSAQFSMVISTCVYDLRQEMTNPTQTDGLLATKEFFSATTDAGAKIEGSVDLLDSREVDRTTSTSDRSPYRNEAKMAKASTAAEIGGQTGARSSTTLLFDSRWTPNTRRSGQKRQQHSTNNPPMPPPRPRLPYSIFTKMMKFNCLHRPIHDAHGRPILSTTSGKGRRRCGRFSVSAHVLDGHIVLNMIVPTEGILVLSSENHHHDRASGGYETPRSDPSSLHIDRSTRDDFVAEGEGINAESTTTTKNGSDSSRDQYRRHRQLQHNFDMLLHEFLFEVTEFERDLLTCGAPPTTMLPTKTGQMTITSLPAFEKEQLMMANFTKDQTILSSSLLENKTTSHAESHLPTSTVSSPSLRPARSGKGPGRSVTTLGEKEQNGKDDRGRIEHASSA